MTIFGAKRVFRCATAIALIAVGCDVLADRWQRHPAVPRYFDVDATNATSASSVLLAGHTKGDAQDERALIYFWRDGATRKTYEGKGYFVSVDVFRAGVWAIRGEQRAALDGSDYYLIRSADGGMTWAEVGRVPARALVQILAVNDREAWIRGVDELFQTTDGGSTWSKKQAPRNLNVFDESLARMNGHVVLLAEGIWSTKDDGKRWTRSCDDCGHVWVVDGDVILAERSAHLFQLRWPDGKRSRPISYEMRPYRLAVTGRFVRIIGAPTGSDIGSGQALFESSDGGVTFSKSNVPVPKRAAVDFAPGGAIFALDVFGNLLTTSLRR